MCKFLLCEAASILKIDFIVLEFMRIAMLLCAALFCMGFLSCGSNGKSGSSPQIIEPKLSSIQKEIFDESCNAPSCHGSVKKGSLSLVAGNSFAQLVGVRSTSDKKNIPPYLRVNPGSPDSSILLIKIVAPDTNQGEAMPKANDKLPQNSVDAIRQWILSGAPNN